MKKWLKRNLVLLAVLILIMLELVAFGQNNISRVEYFVDTDPGFGSATTVPVSPSTLVNNLSFNINTAALSEGFHNIGIRSKNTSGWSLTNRWLMLKQKVVSSSINKMEYFLDNIPDPGFGKATNIPVTSAQEINDLVIPVNISALSNGVHNLFIRSRDNNGTWSITNRFLFIKSQAPPAQVTRMEYFLDNIAPPAFGKGTTVTITPSATVNDLVIPVDISALTKGIHTIYVRSFDNNGSWSITNRWLFLKETLPASNIQKAEYFLNTDPGFGKGINIPVTPGATINNIAVVLNSGSIPGGVNHLYVRTQNSGGSWSLTNHHLFLNEQRNGSVEKVQYFYDTDPGFGKGIPVAINPTTLLNNYLVPVNVTGLSTGKHVMYLRTKSQRGWSLTNKDTFEVTSTSPVPFINVNSVTEKVNCAWDKFRISFHATGTYNNGNHFTVQLSDKDGSFASPVTIGDTITTKSSEVYCVLPSHLPDGTNYRVRVISSNTLVTGISGIDAITIHDRPELGADTSAYIICSGETFNLVPLYNTSGFTTAAWNTNNPGQAPAGTYSLIVSNIYGCKDTAQAFVKQDVGIWTGAVNSNWHHAGNWSNGHIPTEKTHVIVPGVTPNLCEISDTDGTAASVQIKNSGSIKLTNSKKLFVNANCNPLPTGN